MGKKNKAKKTTRKYIHIIVCLALAVFFAPYFVFAKGLPSSPDIPEIIPRTSWLDSKELKDLFTWIPDRKNKNITPDYADVKRIILHDLGCSLDSPTCNSDAVNSIYLIQNIYRFHADRRKWGDIGYNYIVDRKGDIYEGRFGGNGVTGAHTYHDRKCANFNVGTVGIALVGNYQKVDMPEVMYKSLAKLIAWISVNNGINPTEMDETTSVWQNAKNDEGACDTSFGSFDFVFTGPVVLGHKDVEEGNPDPGMVDIERVRKMSSEYYQKYKNYLYQVSGDKAVYDIKYGYKTKFNSVDSLPSSYKNRTIKPISKPTLL